MFEFTDLITKEKPTVSSTTAKTVEEPPSLMQKFYTELLPTQNNLNLLKSLTIQKRNICSKTII